MKQISNRQFLLLLDKLPRVIALARSSGQRLSLRQSEDIRQLLLLHSQLSRKQSNDK